MNVLLSNYTNNDYNPGNKLKIFIWYFVNVLFMKNHYFPIMFFKIFLLKLFGAKIGENLIIKPGISIKYPWFLSIGNNVWIGEDVWIDNLAIVTIEDNVCISQGAMLLCGNHNYKKSTFDLITKEIHVKEGAWIGAKTVVCPGVTINSHAILSLGEVNIIKRL